jgi:acylphosphatase
MIKACSIHVSGKVQGVFFRATTKDKADELGVKGFVRNERDGSVYIEAEAEHDILNQFIDWCNHGPRMARVDSCNVTELSVQNFAAFEIRR